MLNKIKEFLTKAICKCKSTTVKVDGTIKWIIGIYLAFVAICCITYFAAWLWLFWLGKAALADLMLLLQEMVAPTMIGFATFIVGCFVDTNGNGIPDNMEQKDEKTTATVARYEEI